MIKREHKERTMCDYSLQNVRSRPAAVNDSLVTHDFGTGTRGFAASKNLEMAVCLLPGTEIAFPNGIPIKHRSFFGLPRRTVSYSTAIFRQINKRTPNAHHDALEFPDGHIMLLATIAVRQKAMVLQLPAQPANPIEAEAQKRAAYVG
jgi:hypothetical protein